MNLDTLLKQKRPVITDGAMGTYFTQKTGFSIHECEWANISRPELISEIHREYVKAGAQFLRNMGNFTFEEMNLMCIYNTGSRTGLIDSLREMRGELSPEETELRELTDSALGKLQAMSDAEFAELELYPDFDQ